MALIITVLTAIISILCLAAVFHHLKIYTKRYNLHQFIRRKSPVTNYPTKFYVMTYESLPLPCKPIIREKVKLSNARKFYSKIIFHIEVRCSYNVTLTKMKPSKKKSAQVKKSANDKDSTPRIHNYFKIAAKQLNVDLEEEISSEKTDESALRAVYIKALKNKLQGLDAEEDAVDDSVGAVGGAEIIENLDGAVGLPVIALESCHVSQNGNEPAKCSECMEWKAKYDDLQKLCLKLTIRNADMDLKYDALLKTKTAAIPFLKDAAGASSSTDFLTPRELRYLECMSLDKKADSTFVHHCLQYMYKDDLPILSKRTLKGKAEILHISEAGEVERVFEAKDPLTPPKVDRMRSLFIERIDKCGVGAVGYSERIKDTYLNRLIAAAIYNISKKE